MSPFTFHAIQSLDITEADSPNIDVQDDLLILTATRGVDRIRITAPLSIVVSPATTKSPAPAETPKAPIRRRTQYTSAVRTYGFKPGEKSPMAKLKEAEVREIKTLAADQSYINSFRSEHALMKDLAQAYKVHPTTVYQILRGTTWRHVAV
jgi:hypothetical protein